MRQCDDKLVKQFLALPLGISCMSEIHAAISASIGVSVFSYKWPPTSFLPGVGLPAIPRPAPGLAPRFFTFPKV